MIRYYKVILKVTLVIFCYILLVSAAVQIISPNYQVVSENNSFSIFCNATGNPPPTISWQKGGSSISVGEKLTVARAGLEQLGTYQCLANNGIGTLAMASATVVVNCK